MKRFVFKGSLGDVTDQWSAWAKKKIRKKASRNSFHNFPFDNENEKRKKFKILFHFKTKIECHFRPTD